MIRKTSVLSLFALLPITLVQADDGGISFWLPGQFGALAAAPVEPGWSLPLIYYHVSASDNKNAVMPRGGRTVVGLDAKADLLFASPTYTFETPVLGGAQAAISAVAAVARSEASVDATITGPRGRSFSGGTDDSLKGASDLYLLGTLKWNHGVHNFMTYNWKNNDTDYKNGIDAHIDLSASHFFTATTHAGLVGYYFEQVTGDSGSGAVLGDFKSRVAGIGPQAGHFFKVGDELWYANIKGYYEFDAKNRPEGWNMWVSLVVPLSGAK